MFDIAFMTDTPERQDEDGEGWDGLRGRITLGAYTEGFIAPLGYWSRADYERQWVEAAGRILGQAARGAFCTDPFRFWWTMWRKGEAILVHEEFLTPERLAQVTDYAAVPYHLIEDSPKHSEDGELISEWQIKVADVRGFVKRRYPKEGLGRANG